MATIKGNTIDASGSGQNKNEPNTKVISWADRVDEFSHATNEKNMASYHEARFLLSKGKRETFQGHCHSYYRKQSTQLLVNLET